MGLWRGKSMNFRAARSFIEKTVWQTGELKNPPAKIMETF
jgi:hypothetical protein